MQTEWRGCGPSLPTLFRGYGTLVLGVWSIWGAEGYAAICDRSFLELDGEQGGGIVLSWYGRWFLIVWFGIFGGSIILDSEWSIPELKMFFFHTLLDWVAGLGAFSIHSVLELIDICTFWFLCPEFIAVFFGPSNKIYYLSKIMFLIIVE